MKNFENKTILIVDDDEKLRGIIKKILEGAGYTIIEAKNGNEALRMFESNEVNLMILDIVIPGLNGIFVFKKAIEIKPGVPVIIITGYGTIPLAVEATKLGAFDFLEKPFSEERLLLVVKNALKKEELFQDKAILTGEMNGKYKIIGNSPKIKEVFTLIEKASRSDAKVFITGESGTGKELAARAIHSKSKRAGKPFVTINCAALPDQLIESELFGYVKGAFTGVLTDRVGKFESATGGTVFLDEIGDMNFTIQAKLLRVLQENEIEKLGSNKTLKVNVRLITATNKDIEVEVEKVNFREDLFYRLNVIRIHMPSLKERKEDIPLLTEYFINNYAKIHELPPKTLTTKTLALLMNMEWKGNVRELENFVEKMMIMIDKTHIGEKEISFLVTENSKENDASKMPDLRHARALFEKEHLSSILKLTDWNIKKAAKILGIERSLLYRKLSKYSLPSSRQVH